jgi:hypothetical protein
MALLFVQTWWIGPAIGAVGVLAGEPERAVFDSRSRGGSARFRRVARICPLSLSRQQRFPEGVATSMNSRA